MADLRRKFTVLFVVLGLGTTPAGALPARSTTVEPAAVTVDFSRRLQTVDGFGFAQAFQRADVMHGARGLSPRKQREVLDLLLSRQTGAGLSILRLGIGSSPDDPYDLMKSIQPNDPGGPDALPKYEWDGDDGGQVWLAKEAARYGVKRFYADAWSAPGYMKTNGSDSNGGTLCGLQGTECASGDWRQAYANYLIQYARFYRQEGIRITDLGFTNEPDLTVSYASMRFTPAQTVEFTKVIGPAIRRSGLPLKLACCDVAGWEQQKPYTEALEADPRARRWISTYTGHPYVSNVQSPQPVADQRKRHVWMSEWSPNGTTWNENWDDGSGYDGFTVAEDIHRTMTTGNANAYVYWFGASLGTTRGLIQLANPGDDYRVSKRLWALAGYSRFIRPDAVRVQAGTTDPALKVSAYRNTDGRKVVVILNTATTSRRTDLALNRPGARPTAYVTDTTRSMAPADLVRTDGQRLSADLPARSLTTIVLGPDDPPLWKLARKHGKYFGSATDTPSLGDQRYQRILDREFGQLTPANAMKWYATEPQRGVFDFGPADQFMALAKRNNQVVRGHTLVWHSQLAPWVEAGDFSPAELRQILKNHIVRVASHFKGRVIAWDVVNEAFNEDGTYRDTVFYRKLGPGYIADALRWAHQADPRAKLYLNDYNTEGIGPKSDAYYNLIKSLKAQGVPIHGMGIQGHLALQYGFPGTIQANLQRFADLGVEVSITELDIRMPLPATEAKLATQAAWYADVTKACLAVRRCAGITVWDFSDKYSWIPGTFPGEGAAHPWDENLEPKPAYRAIRQVLAAR